METKNYYRVMEETPVDEKVGIRVARLSGDEKITVFGAEIAAGKSVRAHYHREGIELYQVLDGEGLMRIGTPLRDGIEWEYEWQVGKGDCFTIPAGKVHQLANPGGIPLSVLFICAPSHLAGDRFFV